MKTTARLAAAIATLITLLIIGTGLYHQIEGWNYIDSFYFTGITITTIGYGDLVPKTDVGKIVTVIFAMVGVGAALVALTTLAEDYFERRQLRFEKRFGDYLNKYKLSPYKIDLARFGLGNKNKKK